RTLRAHDAASRDEARVTLRRVLAPVRESDVQLDDEVTVAGHVGRPARAVAPFDEAEVDHRADLALGDGLRESRPDGGLLRRVRVKAEGMEQLQAVGVGDER